MIITAGRLAGQLCWSEPWTGFSARIWLHTGTLFLYGIVVGALALLGLSLLLAGARRTSRRGREARRGLSQSRRETAAVSQDRDDLLGQREAARAWTASTPGNGPRGGGQHPSPQGRGWPRLFGHRSGHPQAPVPRHRPSPRSPAPVSPPQISPPTRPPAE